MLVLYNIYIKVYIRKHMVREQSSKIINIKLDASTISKIKKLGKMNESVSSFIKKTIEHASKCDRWWENRYD